METTEKTNKKENGNVKSDVLSGVSAGVGAAIGMVVGGALGMKANAAEVTPPVVPPVKPDGLEVHEEPVKPEPPVKDDEEQTVSPEEEPEILVEDCSYVMMEDGSMMEVATLSYDGHDAIIVDADMDGMADLMIVDANDNTMVEENEIFDLSEGRLAMETLREPDYIDLAQADSDYVNNADVDDYMA